MMPGKLPSRLQTSRRVSIVSQHLLRIGALDWGEMVCLARSEWLDNTELETNLRSINGT